MNSYPNGREENHAAKPQKEQVIGVTDAIAEKMLADILARLDKMNEYEHFSVLTQSAGLSPQSFGFVARKLIYFKNTGDQDIFLSFNDDTNDSVIVPTGGKLENLPLHINRLVVSSTGSTFEAFGVY